MAILHQLNHTQTNKAAKMNTAIKDYYSSINIGTDPVGNGLIIYSYNNIDHALNVRSTIPSPASYDIDNAIIISEDGGRYPVIPYMIYEEDDYSNGITLEETVNDYIDAYLIMAPDYTTSNSIRSIEDPKVIPRINYIDLYTNNDDNSKNDHKRIVLANSIGCMDKNDLLMVDIHHMNARQISYNGYEILSGGFDWRYDERYFIYKNITTYEGEEIQVPEYYVLFAPISNIKTSDDITNYICSTHFSTTTMSNLLSNQYKGDYIAVSDSKTEPGIWIKIKAEYLDSVHTDDEYQVATKQWGFDYDKRLWYEWKDSNEVHNVADRNYATDMKKFLSYKMTKGEDPIYIQYEYEAPVYRDINLLTSDYDEEDIPGDNYKIKCYQGNTKINIMSNNKNLKFSVFYKTLKPYGGD